MRRLCLVMISVSALPALTGCPVLRTELEGVWTRSDKVSVDTLQFEGLRQILRTEAEFGPEYLEYRGRFSIDTTADPSSIDWIIYRIVRGATIAGEDFVLEDEPCAGNCELLGIYQLSEDELRIDFSASERPERLGDDALIYMRSMNAKFLN